MRKGKSLMKILNLKIKDSLGEIKRNIDLKESGISFIYGDIQDPKNLGATINSLGKTLLLKCIDYIYGANEDSSIIKEAIHNYILEATILFKGDKYIIKRILGDSEFIYIGDVGYTLTDYKNYFNIKRSLYNKQFILKKKATEISVRSNPSKDDITSCMTLLNLDNMLDSISSIYEAQDKIKQYKANKKELVSFYGNFDVKQIDEEIYFIDKEVKRVSEELEKISTKIKNIEISDIQQNIIEEYSEKVKILKEIKSEYEKNKLEYERLSDFIKNSNRVDVSSEHILGIYNKAKLEVPEMVKRTIQEVETFHKKVYDERKEFLEGKQSSIRAKMAELQEDIDTLANDINRIGGIIAVNQVYQESIALYEKYNNNLQELRYKEGKLSQVKNIDEHIEAENSILVNQFINVSKTRKENEGLIQSYRDFIYRITKLIYDNDVNSFFDIKVREKHLSARPVQFELNLKGDTGEGVGEVKKNLMDFLICRYNSYMEIMIQDSACYNGIDPRQVSGMLTELSRFADETDKQVIVSINKYQIGDYPEVVVFVESNSIIILSEKENLLGFEF